jgi:hypothetical protein
MHSAPEGFYFQASNGSVALPVAGYDYNSVWTPLLAGLSPAGMAASLAAPDPHGVLSALCAAHASHSSEMGPRPSCPPPAFLVLPRGRQSDTGGERCNYPNRTARFRKIGVRLYGSGPDVSVVTCDWECHAQMRLKDLRRIRVRMRRSFSRFRTRCSSMSANGLHCLR